ncbi:MAG: hypothetical protein LWX56_04125 [Ignavibacteria bacterium]|nr:hypothetical protein [Ignavibacteria bacterium]
MNRLYALVLLILCMLLPACKKKEKEADFPECHPTIMEANSSSVQLFADSLRGLPLAKRSVAVTKFIATHPHSPIFNERGIVGIWWYGRARSVLINGDVPNGWNTTDTLKTIGCGDSTFFYIVYQLPEYGRYDYLLNIDGNLTPDPRNVIITPSGFGPHSGILMPLFVPNPISANRLGIEHGTIDSFSVPEALTKTDKSRKINIYFPPGYSRNKKYPVMYFLDGIESCKYVNITAILDNLLSENKIDPFIAVLIDAAQSDQKSFPKIDTSFSKYLVDIIVRSVDQKYNTLAEPGQRGIYGVSIFGNMAACTCLMHPDVFGYMAGQSISVTRELFEIAPNSNTGTMPPEFFLQVGDFDLGVLIYRDQCFCRANLSFANYLIRKGYTTTIMKYHGGHQWSDWKEYLDQLIIGFSNFRKK